MTRTGLSVPSIYLLAEFGSVNPQCKSKYHFDFLFHPLEKNCSLTSLASEYLVHGTPCFHSEPLHGTKSIFSYVKVIKHSNYYFFMLDILIRNSTHPFGHSGLVFRVWQASKMLACKASAPISAVEWLLQGSGEVVPEKKEYR